VVTVTADEVEAVDNVEVVVDGGVVVPEVAEIGVTEVAPVTATDNGWDAVDVVVAVVVVDDPVVDVFDVVDVPEATGTATGSSVNTSGLPAAVDADPEEAGSM